MDTRMIHHFLTVTAMFLSSVVGAAAQAQQVTAREVVSEIQKQVGVEWQKETVDTFKAGNPDTPVTGIAVTMMATMDVLQRASAKGLNFVITHEPTFYAHLDTPEGMPESDPVWTEKRAFIEKHGMPNRYALVTLHRPSNVDSGERLKQIFSTLQQIQKDVDVVFPVHPRTRQRLAEIGVEQGGVRLLGPLPYIEFLALQKRAAVVITDSGGVQEETTFLRVPCLTLRTTTERPVTVSVGSNVLVGEDVARLKDETVRVLNGQGKKGGIPPLWDGHAAERIADVVMKA